MLALSWLLAPAVSAGTLFRCVGSAGEQVYSSTTAGYRGCRALRSLDLRALGAPRSRRTPRSLAARPAASSALSFAAVDGAVESDARLLAIPSLARVTASVETTARPWMPLAAAHRFMAVTGAVETSARPVLLASALAGARPGQWSYRDARDGLAPGIALAATGSAGDKVLRGSVYRVVHRDGSVEYTNVPSHAPGARTMTVLFSYISTCIACSLHSPIDWNSTRLNMDAYAAVIRAASVEFGVEEAFLRAVIHAESAFNPRALSLKGAQGLMQLMPGTATDMGVADAFDADQNIRGGARYLSLLLRSFAGNERLAAAAYNAGPNAVVRYNGVPPYAETQVYVQRVGTLRKRYGGLPRPPISALAVEAAMRRYR